MFRMSRTPPHKVKMSSVAFYASDHPPAAVAGLNFCGRLLKVTCHQNSL